MRRRLGRPIGINLRLNREFRRGEGGWVDVVWAFMVARMGIKLSGHNPTPGRPQGSPLRTTRPPPLQRYGSANARFVVFVRAGVVRMSGWDPCGRPGVGLWPLNFMCMWALHRPRPYGSSSRASARAIALWRSMRTGRSTSSSC